MIGEARKTVASRAADPGLEGRRFRHELGDPNALSGGATCPAGACPAIPAELIDAGQGSRSSCKPGIGLYRLWRLRHPLPSSIEAGKIRHGPRKDGARAEPVDGPRL